MALHAAAVALLLLAEPSGNARFDAALAQAQKAYNEAEFDEALKAVAAAEKLATASSEQVLVFLYRGVLLANVPDTDAANAAFTQALAIDPEARLPLPVSPKVQAEYLSVQKAAREARPVRPASDAPTKAQLTPTDAPEANATTRALRVPVVPTTAAAVAVAAAATGLAFGVMANNSVSSARAAPWASDKAALRGQAVGQATVATVAWAVAGTAAATAVITWLVLER